MDACVCGNEHSVSIKYGEFLSLSEELLVSKTHSDPWS